ncbi:MAG: FG-GAP repeat domain-containing protein [Pirellulales bacterium]
MSHRPTQQRTNPIRRQAVQRGVWVAGMTLGIVLISAVVAVLWRGDADSVRLPVEGVVPRQVGRRLPHTAAETTGTPAAEVTVPIPAGPTWNELDNPSSDGWSTEVFSDRANGVLKRLGHLLVDQPPFDAVHAQGLVTDRFSCGSLRPEQTRTVFQDQEFVVERSAPSSDPVPAEAGRGVARFLDALRELATPFENAEDLRFKFKIVRVERGAEGVTTRQYFALFGSTPEGRVEQNATWSIRWKGDGRETAPSLEAIDVVRFEQVTTRSGERPLFTDCGESVLKANRSYGGQFLLGLNHWLDRIQDTRYFTPLGNPGLALGDVNGDGLEDLFVCQEAGLPNRLFLQQADGSLTDVSDAWGVDWLESSRSALLIDLDNDGDQDLVVALLGGLVVASNEEARRFQIRRVLPTDDDTMSLTAVDYDLDGSLDLYVCVDYPNDYFSRTRDISVLGGASNRVYHDANNAGRNSLFHNEIAGAGSWQFVDVTARVGLDRNNHRFSLAASWEDYDNDGDPDLYVGNDFGRNNLYRNERTPAGEIRFVDVAAEADVEDSASGMSVAWGDIDRDGRSDVYVGNMFSSAGGRITFQPEFKPDASPEVRQRLRRFARGNTLFCNEGENQFRDISVEADVTVARWAWSSNFVDINNDGWQDIVVANGYITAADSGDL